MKTKSLITRIVNIFAIVYTILYFVFIFGFSALVFNGNVSLSLFLIAVVNSTITLILLYGLCVVLKQVELLKATLLYKKVLTENDIQETDALEIDANK